MNCEHHGNAGIVDCSMTCGHESSPSITAGVIFVLPDSATLREPALTLAALTSFALAESVPFYDPLSPPPRNSDFSL